MYVDNLNGAVGRALFKGAEVEAKIDGRTLAALSKTEQARYIDRFAEGVHAYITEMQKHGFEIVYYFDEEQHGEEIPSE